MTHTVSMPLPWQQTTFAHWFESHHSDRPAHAYLVLAQEDTGGEQMVHAMADSLLCQNPSAQHHACGQCAECQLIAAFSHPDLRIIRPSIMNMGHPIEELRPEKPSKDITIDDVRSLDHMVNQTSHRGGPRVVVLYPAHKLNRNAANALLKTLEEPPANTVFILLAHDVKQLLPTIVSRSQIVHLSKPSTEQALSYLNAIKTNPHWAEYLQQENGAVMRVAELVDGAYFDIQKQWIDGLAQGVRLNLSVVTTAFEKYVNDSAKARLAGEERALVDMRTLMNWLQRWVYDLSVVAQKAAPARYYPKEQAQMERLTAAQVQTKGPAFIAGLHAFSAQLAKEKRMADHPLNTRSWIERLLLQYTQLFD